jgi:hypothetical protein
MVQTPAITMKTLQSVVEAKLVRHSNFRITWPKRKIQISNIWQTGRRMLQYLDENIQCLEAASSRGTTNKNSDSSYDELILLLYPLVRTRNNLAT